MNSNMCHLIKFPQLTRFLSILQPHTRNYYYYFINVKRVRMKIDRLKLVFLLQMPRCHYKLCKNRSDDVEDEKKLLNFFLLLMFAVFFNVTFACYFFPTIKINKQSSHWMNFIWGWIQRSEWLKKYFSFNIICWIDNWVRLGCFSCLQWTFRYISTNVDWKLLVFYCNQSISSESENHSVCVVSVA